MMLTIALLLAVLVIAAMAFWVGWRYRYPKERVQRAAPITVVPRDPEVELLVRMEGLPWETVGRGPVPFSAAEGGVIRSHPVQTEPLRRSGVVERAQAVMRYPDGTELVRVEIAPTRRRVRAGDYLETSVDVWLL